mgnify:CR=1 FL=1
MLVRTLLKLELIELRQTIPVAYLIKLGILIKAAVKQLCISEYRMENSFSISLKWEFIKLQSSLQEEPEIDNKRAVSFYAFVGNSSFPKKRSDRDVKWETIRRDQISAKDERTKHTEWEE